MDRNHYACACDRVTYGMIMDAIEDGARTYEELEERLMFATGCGNCAHTIRKALKELLAERVETE